jgi:hypothetical protein
MGNMFYGPIAFIVGLIPWIIALVVLYFVVFKTGLIGKIFPNSAFGSLALRRKTPDQKAVIKYFASSGCIQKLIAISDNRFDAILKAKVDSYNVFQMALRKLNVDVDQIQAINPVFFDGYAGGYSKLGEDLVYRESKYQLSCLLFSDEQIYAYTFTFDLTSNDTTEHTEEYFYKDVTNVSTNTSVIDILHESGCFGMDSSRIDVPIISFSITVPSDSFSCFLREESEREIQGMKSLLREKKNV